MRELHTKPDKEVLQDSRGPKKEEKTEEEVM